MLVQGRPVQLLALAAALLPLLLVVGGEELCAGVGLALVQRRHHGVQPHCHHHHHTDHTGLLVSH